MRNINPLKGPQSEVRDLEATIAQTPISKGKYRVLTERLGSALETLEGLEGKTTSVFVRTQVGSLKERVVKLYGDLETGLVRREVSQIKAESTSLKKRITLKAIKKLEGHISELESTHLTGIPDRRIIADAKQALEEAKAKLEGKPVTHHFGLMAKQKNVHFVEEIALIPDEVEELFDIARAVYNRDLREAKARFSSLPEEHKRRFQKHMQILTAKVFDDPIETMQALIATVNELVGNGEAYPTRKQIDELFLGLSKLTAEDKTVTSLSERLPK
jgi:hypothetical protein